jgi:acetone carboxylase gamma subunit
MNTRGIRMVAFVIASAMTAILVVGLAGTAFAAKDELPEVSSDGLHLIKGSKVRIAYARPGATLSKYTKVIILDCYVDFVKDWQRDYNMNEVGLSGRVSDKDAEDIKKHLAEEFKKVFSEQLAKKGYPVVEEAGPDVLILRPALINVDVTAPDIATSSRSRTWIKSAGGMTLFLELYDSTTGTLLARVIDPQADRDSFAQQASRVTNKAAADRILRDWADLLAKHLGEVKADTAGN